MIKPQRLRRGDKVAIVSLSRGMLGEKRFSHLLDIARQRLEDDYGLEVVVMDNALKGVAYLHAHPQARAQDLMNAFRDPAIKAIINAIGGDDTIRLLPYIDFDVIRDNPKIFMGYSDTTSNHFMMHKAGLVSYYGGSLMNCWAEYVEMNPYTKRALENAFFAPTPTFEIVSSPQCSYVDNKLLWNEQNRDKRRVTEPETIGHECLQGTGKVRGELLGGCAEVFVELMGTSIFPAREDWRGKILLLEVSDEDAGSELPEYYFAWTLRGLQAQGIFDVISGVVMGKPYVKQKYETYKKILTDIIGFEAGRPELPILYNVNVGHAYPIGILPLGLECEIDCERRSLTVLEPMTR